MCPDPFPRSWTRQFVTEWMCLRKDPCGPSSFPLKKEVWAGGREASYPKEIFSLDDLGFEPLSLPVSLIEMHSFSAKSRISLLEASKCNSDSETIKANRSDGPNWSFEMRRVWREEGSRNKTELGESFSKEKVSLNEFVESEEEISLLFVFKSILLAVSSQGSIALAASSLADSFLATSSAALMAASLAIDLSCVSLSSTTLSTLSTLVLSSVLSHLLFFSRPIWYWASV